MTHESSSGQRALFFVLVLWGLAWKAVAMWHAARDGSKRWYSTLLFVNTAGILDAIYIFRFSSWGRARRSRGSQISCGER